MRGKHQIGRNQTERLIKQVVPAKEREGVQRKQQKRMHDNIKGRRAPEIW